MTYIDDLSKFIRDFDQHELQRVFINETLRLLLTRYDLKSQDWRSSYNYQKINGYSAHPISDEPQTKVNREAILNAAYEYWETDCISRYPLNFEFHKFGNYQNLEKKFYSDFNPHKDSFKQSKHLAGSNLIEDYLLKLIKKTESGQLIGKLARLFDDEEVPVLIFRDEEIKSMKEHNKNFLNLIPELYYYYELNDLPKVKSILADLYQEKNAYLSIVQKNIKSLVDFSRFNSVKTKVQEAGEIEDWQNCIVENIADSYRLNYFTHIPKDVAEGTFIYYHTLSNILPKSLVQKDIDESCIQIAIAYNFLKEETNLFLQNKNPPAYMSQVTAKDKAQLMKNFLTSSADIRNLEKKMSTLDIVLLKQPIEFKSSTHVVARNILSKVMELKNTNRIKTDDMPALTNLLQEVCNTSRKDGKPNPALIDAYNKLPGHREWVNIIAGAVTCLIYLSVIALSIMLAINTGGIATPLVLVGINVGFNMALAVGAAVGMAAGVIGASTMGFFAYNGRQKGLAEAFAKDIPMIEFVKH